MMAILMFGATKPRCLSRVVGVLPALEKDSGALPRAARSPGYLESKDMQEWC